MIIRISSFCFLFIISIYVFVEKENLSIDNRIFDLVASDEFTLLKSPNGLKDKVQFYRLFSDHSEYLKQSDVIVLGNSRPMLGLDHDKVKKLGIKDELKVYNLSFGFSDNVNFGRYLIDEVGSFPKCVVVHVGPYIFSRNFSSQAFDALSKGKWTNYLDYTDFVLASRLQIAANAFLGTSFLATNNHYYYRSAKNGCVKIFGDLKRENFSYRINNSSFSSNYIEYVADFVDWAKERSIQPILFQVPAPGLDASHVAILAKKFDLPYIDPLPGIYSTYDNSHLTPESADKFTEYFLTELKNLIQFL